MSVAPASGHPLRPHACMRFANFSRLLALPLLMVLSACSAGGSAPVSELRSERPPNIIFILADDLGYGDLGVYGQEKIRTPRLDRMAREGIRFTDHYTGSPVCAPARSVLMTGLHAGHTTVRGNTSDAGERVALRAEDVTVAELLRGAGYATGAIGKWGLGEPGTTGLPDDQGFNYWFGFLNQRHAHSYHPEYLWRNRERIRLEGNVGDREGQHAHDLFTEEALGFIERHRDRPFFLYLPYTMPHAELIPPLGSMEPYLDAHGRSIFPETPFAGAGTYRPQPMPRAAYAAMVTRLDRDVGLVLDRLRELGLDRNTLVLFSSDNGPHSAGGNDPTFFRSSGPLRGRKRDLYEGGIRVPMIAWWPGTVEPGRISDHPSTHWDFLPTAAELAGTAAPPRGDGLSYLPTLLGRDQPAAPHLYWEFYEGVPAQAVRMGRWKALRQPAFTGAIELYDLERDLGEQRDVAARHPELVTRIRAIMEREHVPSPYWGTGGRSAESQ